VHVILLEIRMQSALRYSVQCRKAWLNMALSGDVIEHLVYLNPAASRPLT